MKISLPSLTQKRLRWLLDQAYGQPTDDADAKATEINPGDAKLLKVVRSMQGFNMNYRQQEVTDLYCLFNSPYFLEPNSEGTTIWLAMVLAIKELCALSDEELQKKIDAVY